MIKKAGRGRGDIDYMFRKQILNENQPLEKNAITAIMMAVITARIVISFLPSYKIDMGGYRAWSIYLSEKGFAGFYETYHVVYAPAYMYLLWITGNLASLFNAGGLFHEILVKMWAVASDLVGGYLIYLIGKKNQKLRIGFIAGAVYAMNPGVFFNSSIWGQFDSLPATLLLGVLLLFEKGRKSGATVLFVLAVLTKPQSALLLPLVLFLYFKDFKIKSSKDWRLLLNTFVCSILLYILVVLPFYSPTPFFTESSSKSTFIKFADIFYWMIFLYRKSVDDYPYATANAFNIWTILGGQPVNDKALFGGLTLSFWGLIMFLGLIAFTIYYFIKRSRNPLSLYFSAWLIMSGSFFFLTRMHERYMMPSLIFLAAAAVFDRGLIPLLGVASICVLANHWYIYDQTLKGNTWLTNYNPVALTFASITAVAMFYSVYYWAKYKERDETEEKAETNTEEKAADLNEKAVVEQD